MMTNTKRHDYMAALHRLSGSEGPTVGQMMTVCPHLTEDQVAGLLDADGVVYFALPPVRVGGSFLVASYYPQMRGIEVASSRRTAGSYAGNDLSRCDVSPRDYPFLHEAMAYANANWPEYLVQDGWVDLQRVIVQDPASLSRFGHPRTAFVVTVGLRRKWDDVANDRSAPQVQLWDDAIAVASTDPFESEEIQGGRNGVTEYNCAHCGGGLGLTRCSGCGAKYNDDQLRCGWRTPLPPKIVQLLRGAGHEFAFDPERLLVDHL